MIEAVNLTKVFGDFTAVNNVSLNVKAGQLLALLGHNGAGKTTTTRMLTATLIPNSGRANVAGFDTVTQSQEVRRSIGHLTELPGLYSRMYIEEYLDFFGDLYNVPKNTRRERAEEMLKQFDLWETRRLKLGEYSKGMRQKAALIRALIHDPKVLFLDEPTSAMDPYSSKIVRDSIALLKSQNRAIVLCTHNLFEAEMLADTIAIIRKGEIITEGTAEELKNRLLGQPVFNVRLAQNFILSELPEEVHRMVKISENGPDWFNFSTTEANSINPLVLKKLVENNYQVVTISEVSRSLESVYLKIAGSSAGEPNKDETEQGLLKSKNGRKGLFEKKSKKAQNFEEREEVKVDV
jgi:ABC-2 type transport system ATP-binding protein